MKLLTILAKRIVSEVTKIIHEEVIVVDKNGFIIASSDETRVGNYHEGGMIAAKQKEKLIITKEKVQQLEGVKAGINLPVFFQNEVVGVIGITGLPEQVEQFGEIIKRMTELIIQEAHSTERLEWKYRGLETYVYEWLNLQVMDIDFRERGEILGISMEIPRYCILLQIQHEDLANEVEDRFMEREIIELVHEHFQNDSKDVLVRWGHGRFVLLKGILNGREERYFKKKIMNLQQYIHDRTGYSLTIGIGTKVSDPSELSRSYVQAKKALRVAEKKETIMFYEDLTLDVALAEISDETKKEVVEKVLGKIIDEQELMETLDAYLLCNQSVKGTAELLHIHINTLHYRLKRIKELTDYDIRETETAVTFFIALLFWKEFR